MQPIVDIVIIDSSGSACCCHGARSSCRECDPRPIDQRIMPPSSLIGLLFLGCALASPQSPKLTPMALQRLVEENLVDGEVPANADYSSCSSNPEDEMTPAEIIRRNGYPAEDHFVTTEDGYILGLQRIPGAKGSRAVLLHHGLYDSSMCWIVNGKQRSLAYMLAKKGYDVWLGNVRGNTYSKNHTRLSTSDPAFWDFSWQEMGTYDIPAEIEYITALKNDTIAYIGHSMGTTVFFVMANERPDIAKKVRAMFALGPAGLITNVKGFFTFTIPMFEAMQRITKGHSEIYPQNPLFKFVGKCICNRPGIREICRDFIFGIVGFNPRNFDLSMLPLIVTHTPAGSSLKNVFHFIQLTKRGFHKYDYGPKANLRLYNSTDPPAYKLENVNTPIAIFYGMNDFLIAPEDAESIYEVFPNKIGLYKVEDPKFNHLDFVWGYEAPKLVYSKIIDLLEKNWDVFRK